MDDIGQVLYCSGPYRIMALDEEARQARFDGARYVVLTESGPRLRYELTLEDARRWVDGRCIEDLAGDIAVAPHARRR